MEILYKIFHISFLQSNNSLCLIVSAEKIFKFQPIRNKNCPWWPCFCSIEMKSWGPFIDVSCKILLFLAQVSEKSFKNRPSRNKNCLMQLCLLTNWALFREPFINASYHVLVHLVMQFQRRFLEINQSETRTAYGSHVCWRIMTKWAIFREEFP
jgi:hypothetical protein